MLDNATIQTALEEYEFNPAPVERWLVERDDVTIISLLFDIPRDGHAQSHLACAITEAEVKHASVPLTAIVAIKLADMQRKVEQAL